MTSIPAFILEALDKPCDLSAGFTDRVDELAKRLAATLGAKSFVHDEDMNYNVGQSVTFDWKATGIKVETRIYISSKADLYAIYAFDRSGRIARPPGHPLDPMLLPDQIAQKMIMARRVLDQEGYREVPFECFFAKTHNTLTQMDDQPATVFEGLFAEVV